MTFWGSTLLQNVGTSQSTGTSQKISLFISTAVYISNRAVSILFIQSWPTIHFNNRLKIDFQILVFLETFKHDIWLMPNAHLQVVSAIVKETGTKQCWSLSVGKSKQCSGRSIPLGFNLLLKVIGFQDALFLSVSIFSLK